MLSLFGIAMMLRGAYTLMTPDSIYAPIIKSVKFSAGADVVLQNDEITFKVGS